MTDYTNYQIDDFILDEFFIEWVKNGTEAHQKFWDEWLLQNPSKQSIVARASFIVGSINVQPLPEELLDEDIARITGYVNQYKGTNQVKQIKIYRQLWVRIAAILLMFIAIGTLLYHLHNPARQMVAANSYVLLKKINRSAQSILVRMNDGSIAVLKPGSELTYPQRFTDSIRQIYLKGEAFFEIHHDAHKPFLVHSGEMVTRVLGTSFTVRAYENANDFRVIVNTGRVSVYKEEAANVKNQVTHKGVTLIPNELVTYHRAKINFSKEALAVPLALSKERARKEFSFHEVPVHEVIEKLNQAYGVQIQYNKGVIGNCKITAMLSDQSLDQKLQLIATALNANYTVTDGVMKMEGRGCDN